MIKKVIKYLFKTDYYSQENAGRILERIKSGEFDNERRNRRNEVQTDVDYLYIDVKLIYIWIQKGLQLYQKMLTMNLNDIKKTMVSIAGDSYI